MSSVRERIRAAQAEMLKPELLPTRACELLNQLTALMGNCNDEVREAELLYKRVLLASLEMYEAANRARIQAETSPEYQRAQEAKHTKELCVEMIRSLKLFIRATQEEMRLAH